MGRADTLRSEIARLQKTEADLRKDVGKAEAVAASARAAASKKRGDALKTKSDTNRRSYIRSAEAEEKKVVAAEKKIGDLKAKLAKKCKGPGVETDITGGGRENGYESFRPGCGEETPGRYKACP